MASASKIPFTPTRAPVRGGLLTSLITVSVPVRSLTWYAPRPSAPAELFTSPSIRTVFPLYLEELSSSSPIGVTEAQPASMSSVPARGASR